MKDLPLYLQSIEIELCDKWDTDSEIISSNTDMVNNIAWEFSYIPYFN